MACIPHLMLDYMVLEILKDYKWHIKQAVCPRRNFQHSIWNNCVYPCVGCGQCSRKLCI